MLPPAELFIACFFDLELNIFVQTTRWNQLVFSTKSGHKMMCLKSSTAQQGLGKSGLRSVLHKIGTPVERILSTEEAGCGFSSEIFNILQMYCGAVCAA